MARLPIPGDDKGTWGSLLNDFLQQSLDTVGALKPNSVGASQITDGSITTTELSAAIQTTLNLATNAEPAGLSAGTLTTLNSRYATPTQLTTGLAAKVSTINGVSPDVAGNVVVATASSTTGYDIIILAGQSNMSGRGTPYSSTLDPVNSRIFQYKSKAPNANTIIAAAEPLDMHDTPSGIGPGLQFARWYAARTLLPGRNILLVPVAHGGTALSTTATPLGWRRGVSGNLYANMITQAQGALTAGGAGSAIVGMLWLQGETDGDANVTGSQYQTDLDALLNGLRTDLSLPGLPLVIGTMVPEYYTTGTRAAINAVHRDTPNRIAHTDVALPATGMNNGDGNHFSGPGQRFNGKSMYDAFERISVGLVPYSEVPSATLPGQVAGLTLGTATTTTQPLSWTATSGATSYLVEYKIATDSSWTTFGSPTTNSTTVTGLTLATSYNYRVSAVNSAGAGTASATSTGSTASSVTIPGQVAGLASNATTSTSESLTWTATSGATSYLVEYKLTSGSSWTTSSSPTTNNATVSALTASTSYDFRVSAINSAGTGTASATLTITTNGTTNTVAGVASPAQAYSLRKVNSAYSGSAVTVRRSSDNTTADIGFVSGNLDTTTLLAFAGSGDAFVTTWYDQSGNTRNITQTTVAAQPKIVAAGAMVTSGSSAKPAVLFDGSDDVLFNTTPALYGGGTASVFTVLKSTAVPSAQSRVWAESISTVSTDQYGLLQPDGGTSVTGAYPVMTAAFTKFDVDTATPSLATTPMFNASIHQNSATDSGTSIAEWTDATSILTYSYTRQTSVKNRFAIGGVIRNASLAPHGHSLSEWISFPTVLSTSDRQLIEASQKAFFGTP